jgi:hypothetical protein
LAATERITLYAGSATRIQSYKGNVTKCHQWKQYRREKPPILGKDKTEEVASLQSKTLILSSMLCLVCFTTAACSPALGPDDRAKPRIQGVKGTGNNLYQNPSGPYDDDPGFKNDFQLSDLNPNLVTGQNQLYNVNGDAKILADLAAQVDGVTSASATINGGTAKVNIQVEPNSTDRDARKIQSRVYNVLKQKMPRYNIDVRVR